MKWEVESEMRIAVDLHIHSALSPCADDDMTPNNIVNMAMLKKLDAISITDHNSCDNVEQSSSSGFQIDGCARYGSTNQGGGPSFMLF